MEDKLKEFLSATFGAKITGEYVHRGQLSFYVAPGDIVEVAHALRNDPALAVDYLCDICAVDHLKDKRGAGERFEVIYNFLSLIHTFRFFLRVRVSDGQSIPTLSQEWRSADWLEREVFDLLGVVFSGRDDLHGAFIKPPQLDGQFPHRKDFGIQYEIPQFSHNKELPIVVVPDNPNH